MFPFWNQHLSLSINKLDTIVLVSIYKYRIQYNDDRVTCSGLWEAVITTPIAAVNYRNKFIQIKFYFCLSNINFKHNIK